MRDIISEIHKESIAALHSGEEPEMVEVSRDVEYELRVLSYEYGMVNNPGMGKPERMSVLGMKVKVIFDRDLGPKGFRVLTKRDRLERRLTPPSD